MKEVEFRRQLAKGGKAAIEASNDEMIQLARSIDKDPVWRESVRR